MGYDDTTDNEKRAGVDITDIESISAFILRAGVIDADIVDTYIGLVMDRVTRDVLECTNSVYGIVKSLRDVLDELGIEYSIEDDCATVTVSDVRSSTIRNRIKHCIDMNIVGGLRYSNLVGLAIVVDSSGVTVLDRMSERGIRGAGLDIRAEIMGIPTMISVEDLRDDRLDIAALVALRSVLRTMIFGVTLYKMRVKADNNGFDDVILNKLSFGGKLSESGVESLMNVIRNSCSGMSESSPLGRKYEILQNMIITLYKPSIDSIDSAEEQMISVAVKAIDEYSFLKSKSSSTEALLYTGLKIDKCGETERLYKLYKKVDAMVDEIAENIDEV